MPRAQDLLPRHKRNPPDSQAIIPKHEINVPSMKDAGLNLNVSTKSRVIQTYQDQKELLARSGRTMEAGRKEVILNRLLSQTDPSSPEHDLQYKKKESFGPVPKISSKRIHLPKQLVVIAASLLMILTAGLILTDAQIELDPVYHLQRSSAQEVEEEVQRQIESAGADGAFIVHSNVVPAAVSPDKVDAMIHAARKHGLYEE